MSAERGPDLTGAPVPVENHPVESDGRTGINPAFSYLIGAIVAVWLAMILRSFDRLSAFQNISAVFLSLLLEGIPFVLLGSFVASLVLEFVPPAAIARIGSRLGMARIPLAALSGFVVPICECAIVPTMRRLREKGLGLAEAITFLVAVPLINPVVIASTIVAFRDRPGLVLGRFLGGFVVIMAVAGVFSLRQRAVRFAEEGPGSSRSEEPRVVPVDSIRLRVPIRSRILHAVEHTAIEFVEVIGYYSVGALLSAIVQVTVPVSGFFGFSERPVTAILAMIALAFLLSVCSEADAFIGRSFLGVMPEASILAFLVFGPMFDLKNLLLLRRVLTPREILILVTVLVLSVTVLGVAYASILL